MAVAHIKATIPGDIQMVWKLVTSLTHYTWRSNIASIDILEEDKIFVEHTKDGYSTRFTITAFDPCKTYQFQMENQNMKGWWTGSFAEGEGQRETIIEFTEHVTVKRLLLRPFAIAYLKRQQRRYVEDLKRAVLLETQRQRGKE